MSDMRQFTATPTVEELEAEIERLWSVLEEIAEFTEAELYEYGFSYINSLACEALENKDAGI